MTTLRPGMVITVTTVAAASVAVAPEGPDNSYQPDISRRCMARKPEGFSYLCYATKGHAGDHIGYKSMGRDYDPEARWPLSVARIGDVDVTPYDGTTRLMYGFTGGRGGPGGTSTRPWSDRCVCNQCCQDKPRRAAGIGGLCEGGPGKFMRVPEGYRSGPRCGVCDRKEGLT